MKIEQFDMGGKLHNFTYLVICEESKEAAIIDPGSVAVFPPEKFRRIARYIKKRYLLKYVINTHRHYDHTMGNRYFQKHFHIPVLSYKNGLREDDIILIGNQALRVIETPGHTADSLSFYCYDDRTSRDKRDGEKQGDEKREDEKKTGQGALFTGDTLFARCSGSTEDPDSDRQQLGATLRRLITLFPPETIVWPGHNFGKGRITTLGRERVKNVNREEYRLESAEYGGDLAKAQRREGV